MLGSRRSGLEYSAGLTNPQLFRHPRLGGGRSARCVPVLSPDLGDEDNGALRKFARGQV